MLSVHGGVARHVMPLHFACAIASNAFAFGFWPAQLLPSVATIKCLIHQPTL